MRVSVSLGRNALVMETKWDGSDPWDLRRDLLDVAYDEGLVGFVDEK